MQEQEQQTTYSIFGIILLFSILFAAGTLIITAPSYVFDLMPKHKIIYLVLLCISWLCSYKLGMAILVGKIKLDLNYQPNINNDVSEKINMDICTGIAPPGNRWHSDSSNNPATSIYDPFASINNSSTYSLTNRD